MCGITGWIDYAADLRWEQKVLEAMTHVLKSRGPDASATWLSHHAALGHCRLIVVDPTGGKQPMSRRQGNNCYVLTYNGELYNTDELRRELINLGYNFYTRSDTEVLLVSFIAWGRECVTHLNGIFAFAVWDEAGQSLFMARDRMGVKPLFYAQRGRAFLFGSEIKALLAHPLVQPEIDAEGLAEVFLMGPSRTPGHGVFRGIYELKPGYSLEYNRQGTRLRQYWALESRPHPDDLVTTVATVGELFQNAVQRQLVADVPVCTLLSGGLDSSAITAFAAEYFRQAGHEEFHTFSVDYLDNEQYFQTNRFQPNSDAPWVQRVSEYLKTTHRYIRFDTPELVDALKISALARDLPGMADIDSSLYLFCREIKKQATVAISGECADEVFGGYPWFNQAEAAPGKTFPWIRQLEDRTRLLSPHLLKLIRPEEYVRDRYEEALHEVPRLPGESPREERVREMFYLNLTRFMPTLLDRKDRMSMAVGLEVRVPFCDHHLVEYTWNIPWSMKRCQEREKGILRQALVGVLPDDVLWRKKSPYPKTHNPSYLNAVRNQALEIIADPNSALHQLVDTAAIKAMAQSGEQVFGAPWFGQLMNDAQYFAYLIQVDTWFRHYGITIRV